MLLQTNKQFIQNFLNSINLKLYFLFLIFVQIFGIYLSYKNLFYYEGCTLNKIREFSFFNQYLTFNYPQMCDESFYFHGFQWINHIYENGFVYQDRPLYLAIGFIIYRFLFIVFLIFGLNIDPISLLLLASLIIQIIALNMIAYVLTKFLFRNFNRFYFLVFLMFTLFSFEYRLYFFLPSNSTFYLLIFLYSIYSIKSQKLNGFFYGVLFTISGYGVIGFIYQILFKIKYLKREYKNILYNLSLFMVPTLSFELFRLLLGRFQGEEYGVRYIHAAEAPEYQQFVWFFRTIFIKSYEPYQSCHQLSEFLNCYLNITSRYISLNVIYIFSSLILFIYYLIKFKNLDDKYLRYIFSFTLFSYVFISFQGIYDYRFIYYSFGFGILTISCYFLTRINNDIISIVFLMFSSIYTLTRYSYENFTYRLENIEIIILIIMFLFVLIDYISNRKINVSKSYF